MGTRPWLFLESPLRNINKDEFERALATIASIPTPEDGTIATRLVSLLWYIPIFTKWNGERFEERGGNKREYEPALKVLMAELQLILGIP